MEHLGNHLSEEHRAKISAASIGRVMSAETRAKISATKTGKQGYVPTAEVRAKLSTALMGHIASLETREKMSKGNMGHPVSDVWRANLSKAHMGKHPSEETRSKMSGRKGELSPRWKGGITSENTRLRTSDDYVAWRTAVFARDGYACKKCGIKGIAIEAHHIDGFSEFPERRLDIDNGIVFCTTCHRAFHHQYGRLHNRQSQVDEFLSGGVS